MPLTASRLAGLLLVVLTVLPAGEAVATVATGDAKAWGSEWKPAAAEQRLLPAGARGSIALPAWWGQGLRPPAGTAWRVEIEFQDTVSVPVQVEVFAGLPAWRHVHRIGGLGDKEWKTARVPLSWDMVMRQPGTTGTAIAVRAAGADLPVRAVRVLRGDAVADETRWQAETRDWIDRVQTEARAKAKLPPAESAVLDAAQAKSRIVPFVRSYLRPIELTSAPQTGEVDVPLKLRLARNETEPAQFGIHAPAADVLGCTVDLDVLRTKDGTVLQAGIELLTAEYAVVSDGQLRAQRLWPAYRVDIRKGGSQMFLLRVTTDAKQSQPGVYRGTIAIRGEAMEASLPVEVEVLPVTLKTMDESGLRVAMCVDNLPPRHELEVMAKANLDGLCFFYYTLPLDLQKKSPSEFAIDFTIADDFMVNAKAAGIRNIVYYLGGDPYGFPDTLPLLRELYRRVAYAGTDMMAARLELMKAIAAADGRLPPEVLALLKSWTGQFLDHAKSAGWPEIYLSPFDEPAKWSQKGWGSADFYHFIDKRNGQEVVARVMAREKEQWLKDQAAAGNTPVLVCSSGAGPWIKTAFKEQCAAIHAARPDARIYASIHHAEPGAPFRDDVDIYSSDAIHEDREMGTYVKASNDPKKWYWLYDFSRDAGDPANMRYIFGFFHSAFDTSGSLCWAWNWGGQYDSSTGDGPSLFAYPSPHGVITQPQFDGIREAFDDRRYIETLRQAAAAKGKTAEIATFLGALADKSGRKRPGGKWDNVGMLYRETGDANALDTLRSEVIAQLLKLQ